MSAQVLAPETIAKVWKLAHPGECVSHSTLYRALRLGLIPGCLPETHLRRREKRKYKRNLNYNSVQPEHTIHDRPAVVNRRERIGDWEGDTIFGGKGKGYLVTCVERCSRYIAARIAKNKSCLTVNEAMLAALDDLPVKTLTLNNGSEFADFKALEEGLSATVYFAALRSPWQRGTNENLNDALRFFFPRGTDFRKLDPAVLQYVVDLLNDRPRKCLHWLSPRRVFLSRCCT